MAKAVSSAKKVQQPDIGIVFQKFLFKAHATALRGTVRKPYHQKLGHHAALETYAGQAGRSTARNEKFALRKEISYGAVYSEIVAESSKNTFHTVAQTTIENLRILDRRLTADKIVARVESFYDAKYYPLHKISRVLPTGSQFVNLKLDGKDITPRLHPAFTLTDRERKDFFAGKHDGDPKYLPGQIPPSLHVEGFGTIFFAEWVWVHPDEQHEQHLIMLRLALGSDWGAELDCGAVGSNGSGWPP